ncbi:MAG TPA: peptidyl-prolyl cis-trans isomerase [Candidatus Methylomirabilis sp.]|nr:peptidyl-prolyl cis-trans isomerase [Candidatus Methylomirabilis sp.]
MTVLLRGAAVAAGVLFAAVACGRSGGDAKAQGPAVLKVNDKAFTAADVEKEISQEVRRAPQQLGPFLASKEGQKQLVDRMLRRELLLQEAEKRKLGDKPEVTDQVMSLRRELMIRALLQEEIGSKIKVEDKDVQEYYSAHPEEFSGDKVRARHILVQTEEEAKQVQERLAKNESFEELAKTLSRDSGTAAKGGDLDYFSQEQMVPEFARAAFALKPGEVSGIVKTPFGYHLIKLVDRKKGEPQALEQVKAQLQRRLLDERQNQRFTQWIKDLEGAAKITRDESLLPVGSPPVPVPGAPGTGTGDAKNGGKS